MGRNRFAFLILVVCLALSLAGSGTGWSAQSSSEKNPGDRPAVAKKKPTPRAPAKTGAAEPAKAPGTEPGHAKAAGGELTPGQVEARAAMLLDVASGTVLFEQNPDELIEPASFTKILSLYLIFDALKQGRIQMKDEVWVSETAWRTGGSKMFVGVGTKVPLEDLLMGIAVVSGNDACVAAAEHLYGSVDTFVEAMNRKAQELGMTNSRFLNPHGLPAEGQITTARDMATLDVAYLQRFPESLRFHSMREYTYNNIVQYNRNHLLLKDQTVDGLKTGFVAAAGYHLSATAQREGMRLAAVVMGAGTPGIREREALKLLNYGFRNFAQVMPFPPGEAVTKLKVWKGMQDEVSLYPVEAASFVVSQAQKKLLRWEVHSPSEITAPVAANQKLGEIVFYLSDQPKRTVALATREEIAQAGWFKRTWQSLFSLNQIDWRWAGAISGGILLVGFLLIFLMNRRGRQRSFN